jgi:hypothetical protein
MKIAISILTLSILLSSCAYHIGVINSNPNYSSTNYELTRLAVATASTNKLLGIGGLKKDALVLEAKKNLYAAYPLKKGQSYANMTVDFKNTFIFIYTSTMVTISADIVQIYEDEDLSNEYQPIFNQIREKQKILSGDISLGDTVMTYLLGIKYDNVVTKILPGDRCQVNTISGELTKFKELHKTDLFLIKDLYSGSFQFKIGQVVSIHSYDKRVNGTIVALGNISAIIEVEEEGKQIYLKRNYTAIRKIDS